MRSNREATVLPNHGFPLGVEEHMPPRIKTHEFAYEPGSMMLLYTDGLIEFDHDLLDGEVRLLAAAAESVRCGATHPAKFIADGVLGDITPIDDVAVLTISFLDG
ncbi:MAG: serine/threonine-protein phosphatase [Candidatus Eremiobacteraeota bacterium]|nr:serine/threonine-protein phosphatase [Candidatus Eremiobacteraeota bacterium]